MNTQKTTGGVVDGVGSMSYQVTVGKAEWDGDGLPPVGYECEIKRVAYWMPVTVQKQIRSAMRSLRL